MADDVEYVLASVEMPASTSAAVWIFDGDEPNEFRVRLFQFGEIDGELVINLPREMIARGLRGLADELDAKALSEGGIDPEQP